MISARCCGLFVRKLENEGAEENLEVAICDLKRTKGPGVWIPVFTGMTCGEICGFGEVCLLRRGGVCRQVFVLFRHSSSCRNPILLFGAKGVGWSNGSNLL